MDGWTNISSRSLSLSLCLLVCKFLIQTRSFLLSISQPVLQSSEQTRNKSINATGNNPGLQYPDQNTGPTPLYRRKEAKTKRKSGLSSEVQLRSRSDLPLYHCVLLHQPASCSLPYHLSAVSILSSTQCQQRISEGVPWLQNSAPCLA